MGTSKSLKTPSGEKWKQPKLQLTRDINGTQTLDSKQFVRTALRALGGLGINPRTSFNLRGVGTSTKGRAAAAGGGAALSEAVQGLGSFGSQISTAGLDGALRAIGLDDLRGRPAAEIVARIAEHLSRNADRRQAEILEVALRDAIFEVAAAEGDGSYDNLEEALQKFIEREGLEGFVELFLSQYLFTAIWSYFENHVSGKADANEIEALTSAVQDACRNMVIDELRTIREEGRFDTIDWFGSAGKEFADKLISQLEKGLTATS